MQRLILDVEGMSCKHCAHSIMKALLINSGITEVDVKIEEKKVYVKYTNTQLDQEKIKNMIEDVGYHVKSMEEKNV
ncbi:MAG: heavy-metal-associated domain-containing protein [Erysipelotrichaceae bacterium]